MLIYEDIKRILVYWGAVLTTDRLFLCNSHFIRFSLFGVQKDVAWDNLSLNYCVALEFLIKFDPWFKTTPPKDLFV
jgi:hypothetical protein